MDPLDIVTVRIPELTSHPGPLAAGDKIPVWYAALDKTRHTTLSDIRDYCLTGGVGAALPVVQNGDSILHDVTSSEAGGNIVSIPALAGKSFKLSRSGRPLRPQTGTTPGPTDEYVCLSAGGFQLLQTGDVLFEGERFELVVFSLQGGSTNPNSSTGGAKLIAGRIIVTSNLTFDPDTHLNKLISIRANTDIITYTIPDLDAVPDDTIIPIETTILNSFQATIATQGGQYIYMRNGNYTSVYMGKSESLWLYRGSDGWYVINDFANNYDGVGEIKARYKVGLNDILADGSLLSRAAHPRLWQEVQTFGSSLVSEAAWQTASVTVAGRSVSAPYRGCYSTGDGSTTFRVPDLRYMALRGLPSSGVTDNQRHHNYPGGYQRHEFESHQHHNDPWNKSSGKADEVGGNTPSGIDNINQATEYRVGDMFSDEWSAATMQPKGGAETRMENTGVYWTIKE